MNQNLDLNGLDLFKTVKELIAADDQHGDGIIAGGELASRALVVIIQNQTKLVWARTERKTGIPEIDALLDGSDYSPSGVVKSEAANLYAVASELAALVEAGGRPVGVVGFTYNESFVSSFHYVLPGYANDGDIEAFLVDQEAMLRGQQQAIDAANTATAVADAAAEAATEVLEARLVDEEYEQAHGGLEPNPTEAEEERDALRFLDEQKLEPVWNDITQPLASETELEKNYRDKDGGGW